MMTFDEAKELVLAIAKLEQIHGCSCTMAGLSVQFYVWNSSGEHHWCFCRVHDYTLPDYKGTVMFSLCRERR